MNSDNFWFFVSFFNWSVWVVYVAVLLFTGASGVRAGGGSGVGQGGVGWVDLGWGRVGVGWVDLGWGRVGWGGWKDLG